MRNGKKTIQMGFKVQVALITGGTAGIGEARVRLVASLGARVVFVGRDRLKGERLERELTSIGNEVVFLQADLRVVEEARETVPFRSSKIRSSGLCAEQCRNFGKKSGLSPSKQRRTSMRSFH
jgi:NADP-dependent 3-hydroxy acid dehydrogenase YdfG